MSSFLQTCHLPGDKNVFNCSRDRNHRLCWQLLFLFFLFFFLLAAIDSTLKRQSIESAAQLLHIVTSSAQHSIVQIWSGGSRKRRWRNPRCCYFKWLQETRAPTHVMGFPLSVPQQPDVLNMGICLFPPPFPPHPFLSLSPSRGSDSLGGGWVRLQLWGRF